MSVWSRALAAAAICASTACGYPSYEFVPRDTTDTGASGTDTAGGGDTKPGDDTNSGGDTTPGGETGSCTPACPGAHMTCDPADNKCKPDGTTTNVGGTCRMSGVDPKCGTDPSALCIDSACDGFPGGYCSYGPCSATELCPIGATCAHLNGGTAACWKICTTDADCRTPDYGCFNIDPLYVSGAGHSVCMRKTFDCNKNADCPAIKPNCTVPPGTCG